MKTCRCGHSAETHVASVELQALMECGQPCPCEAYEPEEGTVAELEF